MRRFAALHHTWKPIAPAIAAVWVFQAIALHYGNTQNHCLQSAFLFSSLFHHLEKKRSVWQKQRYHSRYRRFCFSTKDMPKIRSRPRSEPGSDYHYLMRITGLEPARLLTPEPKSGASANSAIPARLLYYIKYIFNCQEKYLFSFCIL